MPYSIVVRDSCPTRCLPTTIHCFRLHVGHVFYFLSINLPIMLSGFGQGSSNILPRRLSSSKILFSLFAILVYIFCYISSCSILKVTLLECFSTVCYRRVASTTRFSCSNKILFSSSFSNTFCALSISPRRSLTILPGICSTQPAFSGTSFLA